MHIFIDKFRLFRYRYRLKRQKLDRTAFRIPAPKMTTGAFRFSWSIESLEFGQSTASSIENDRLWQCAYPLLWLARITGAIRIPTKQGTWKWMAMRAYSWMTLILLLLGLCGNVAFFRPGFEHMGPITIVKCITLVFWASAVVSWWMLR